MTVPIAQLRELEGRVLPGGEFVVEPHEAFIADAALRSSEAGLEGVHPVWWVFASLRCMGITVEELCLLAHQGPADVLLFGNCRLTQHEPLEAGVVYTVTAELGHVTSRTSGDGSRLDGFEVAVRFCQKGTDQQVGEVVSTYLLKRGSDD